MAEMNVLDSDGTLLLSYGDVDGEPAVTQGYSRKHRRPCFHVDLTGVALMQAVEMIGSWIDAREIQTLNVEGPRASRDPEIYERVRSLLRAVMNRYLPRTVEEAVNMLIADLPLKDKNFVAHLQEDELPSLHPSVRDYIRKKLGLLPGNESLLESCRHMKKDRALRENDALMIVLTELWKKLQEAHVLRVIK
jgi:hypothetical protein